MNDQEAELFEAELRRLTPSPAPESIILRREMDPAATSSPSRSSKRVRPSVGSWSLWLRWFLPATAAVGLLMLMVHLHSTVPPNSVDTVPSAPVETADWRPEEIELDRQLVAAYEGVAELPGGVPLRFRFYDWQEQFTFRNSDGSLEIEQSGPRFEVVPVSLEIY